MKALKLCAAIAAMILIASCGGNNTSVGVTITSPTTNPVPVQENGNQLFSASATGISTTTVYWQVCLPSATITVQPTVCTPIPNVTPAGTPGLTGYGTITQVGLYTAPGTIPQPNSFVVMATSTVSPTTFAVIGVEIAPRVQVQVYPTTASIAQGEHYQFTATVTGTQTTSVTWEVDGNAGGTEQDGYICPNPLITQPCAPGEYFAPIPSPGSVTIKAVSTDDITASGSASVTVSSSDLPAFTGIVPSIVSEGSAQQDVYVEGSNLLSTTVLQVGNTTLPPSAMTYVSGNLVRATIPGSLLQQPGNLQLTAESQGGQLSVNSFQLTVNPMRPALVAMAPSTADQAPTGTGIEVTGGYYVPGKTTAVFNGSSTGVTTSFVDSRHMNVQLPAGSLNTPGLYSMYVENSDAAAANVPYMSARNLAVVPSAGAISGVPLATLGVGAGPTAVAMDYATGNALVVNTGENTVSVVNLATNSVNPNKIPVGNTPTGIAVDDLLSPPLALVVNNADQTVTTIDLATMSVVGTPLSVSLTTVAPVPLPYSIGINPMTHRAIVTYQNTNEATILDLSSGTPTIVTQVGGQFSNPPFGTGNNPTVSVDERLNWAVVTPGSSGNGVIDIVDLGRDPIPGVDSGRAPQMAATAELSLTSTPLGVGVNQETHQAFLTDLSLGDLATLDVFNGTVNATNFAINGITVSEPGFDAAAANGLTNEGIAVNSGGSAVVAELDNGNVLQTINGLGNNPVAVALDPATNEGVIVNQADGTVSIVSLGAARSNQIVEASPETSLTSTAPVTLTITGSGFEPGAVVRLDQSALATATVPSSCTTAAPIVCRQLTATVPATLLESPRRFILDVLNADSTVSNVSDFTVIQSVVVGNLPVGVAVDTVRHMAIVTNYTDGTADLVALSPETPVSDNGGTAGSVGVVGPPTLVGSNPEGVGVVPRLGLAVVANNLSNNFSVIDETQVASPKTTSLCSGCSPTGVGVNSDLGQAAITFQEPVSPSLENGEMGIVDLSNASGGSPLSVDQVPLGVAIDPTLNYAAVACGQTGSIFMMNLTTDEPAATSSLSNFALPTMVIFDALNQVFLVANSEVSAVGVVNPTTFQTVFFPSGINPTSMDYDFQTATLVTINSTINTMSVMNYDCPPVSGTTSCSNPKVQAVVTAGVPQVSNSVVVGANAVAIDPQLDIAVTVDPDNNRVLLIPLPH